MIASFTDGLYTGAHIIGAVTLLFGIVVLAAVFRNVLRGIRRLMEKN